MKLGPSVAPPSSTPLGGGAHLARRPAFCDGALHPGHRAGRGAPPGAAAHFRLLQGGAGTRCNFSLGLGLVRGSGSLGSPLGRLLALPPPLFPPVLMGAAGAWPWTLAGPR